MADRGTGSVRLFRPPESYQKDIDDLRQWFDLYRKALLPNQPSEKLLSAYRSKIAWLEHQYLLSIEDILEEKLK